MNSCLPIGAVPSAVLFSLTQSQQSTLEGFLSISDWRQPALLQATLCFSQMLFRSVQGHSSTRFQTHTDRNYLLSPFLCVLSISRGLLHHSEKVMLGGIYIPFHRLVEAHPFLPFKPGICTIVYSCINCFHTAPNRSLGNKLPGKYHDSITYVTLKHIQIYLYFTYLISQKKSKITASPIYLTFRLPLLYVSILQASAN